MAAPCVFSCLEPLWRPSSRPLEANLLTIARDFSFFFSRLSQLFCFCPRLAFRPTSVGCGLGGMGYSWAALGGTLWCGVLEGSLISIYNQVTKYHNSMFKVFITLWTTTTVAKTQRHTPTKLKRTVELRSGLIRIECNLKTFQN